MYRTKKSIKQLTVWKNYYEALGLVDKRKFAVGEKVSVFDYGSEEVQTAEIKKILKSGEIKVNFDNGDKGVNLGNEEIICVEKAVIDESMPVGKYYIYDEDEEEDSEEEINIDDVKKMKKPALLELIEEMELEIDYEGMKLSELKDAVIEILESEEDEEEDEDEDEDEDEEEDEEEDEDEDEEEDEDEDEEEDEDDEDEDEEEEEDEDEDEEDDEDEEEDDITSDAINKMTKKEIKAFIKDEELEIDYDDYESLDEVKEAIIEELDLEEEEEE